MCCACVRAFVTEACFRCAVKQSRSDLAPDFWCAFIKWTAYFVGKKKDDVEPWHVATTGSTILDINTFDVMEHFLCVLMTWQYLDRWRTYVWSIPWITILLPLHWVSNIIAFSKYYFFHWCLLQLWQHLFASKKRETVNHMMRWTWHRQTIFLKNGLSKGMSSLLIF